MLGLSIRGRHIHSTLPLAAISAVTSQSDKNPNSAIGGNGFPPGVDRRDRRALVSGSVTGYTLAAHPAHAHRPGRIPLTARGAG
jgi:hypothetical protein